MKNINFGIDHRSLVQYKNIFKSLLFRGISVASSFAVFPLTLSYLSQENYGVWLTIYSIVGWTSFLDFGLGNGMKNKLIQLLALDNYSEARKVISTGYVILFFIVLFFISIFSLLYIYIDWNSLLNVSNKHLNINLLIYICFVLFAVKFFLDLINQVLLALQKVSYTNFISCVSSVCILLALLVISKVHSVSQQNNLFLSGFLISFIPVLILFLYSGYIFTTSYKHLMPSINLFERKYVDVLVSKGFQFFIIQISALIIFSTDNILIARLFSSADVTVYNIAYRLFSVFTIIWGVVLMPYWAAFGEAFTLNDYDWIKKTINNLLKIWLLFQLLIIGCLLFINQIYKVWIGATIHIPFGLSIFMAAFISLSTYCNLLAFFVNGIGKIKLQLFTSVFAGIINIPLAILFSKKLGFGLSGIIIATFISLLLGAILITIQYKKIISKSAFGIWNS